MAPGHAIEQDLLTLDLPPGLTLGDLRGFVTAETNLPQNSQEFYLNSKAIRGDNKSLEDLGIGDEEMLVVVVQPTQGQPSSSSSNNASATRAHQQQQQQQRQQQDAQEGAMWGDRDRDPQQIEQIRASILGNPAAMAQVRAQRPALAEAINDASRFRAVYEEMLQEDNERKREKLEQQRLLNEDPFNVEAQLKIEEIIRQQAVQENLQFAYEHNPEVFARVTMLYIPVEVNRHPIKAFVDSGAQTTIMSPSCAETCGIMRLIDERYSGVARGVGTAKILGRVHSSDIKIGPQIFPCSFTVMEGKDVDLLLGLDMLKRFQAVIDLKRNKLVFGDGNEVSFLGEAEIPKSLDDAQQNEPTVDGPNGTEIGAQSGTVKPAGTSAAAAAAAAAASSSSSSSAFQGQGHTLGASTNSKAPATANPAPQASAATSGRTHPPEAIEQLQSLGFTRAEAVAALDACGGNVEYAAGLLFQG